MNRKALERPFDAKEIKSRRGRSGESIDYLSTSTVIRRLNEAFESEWSFEIVSHEICEQEVVVLGKLSYCEVGISVTKMQFGNNQIARHTQGKYEGEIVSLGDNYKAAVSDSLKKCATQFGVGLSLYSSDTPKDAKVEPKPPQKEAPQGISELKNHILQGERKLANQKGTAEAVMRDVLREKFLEGSKSLELPKEKLEEYYAALRTEYASATK